ncbi:DUF998 domain-containing protein [Streptomyces sp. P38-E01]|uniref:DUF998 domain-containing protein n=1 Tax=Streptomyces tardus TaxID=2780544 RepID=A0A949JCI9_9ACTN|nr:DUF998 domain-containing protein [Streptomyces tardus]MBU7597548.1 DUF998 domain-containing protein [Streptomyces tardus]
MRWAGVVLVVAAVGYVLCEALAASQFPGYSYAHHYISDLGVPYESEEGRGFRSRAALLMNLAFVGQGVLLLLGVVLVLRGARNTPRAPLLGPGALYAVGMLLVGTVHAGPREAADGTSLPHAVGAGAAIVCGNVLALVAARMSERFGGGRRYRCASAALGVLGLLSLVMFVADSGSSAFHLLPDGVWERLAVYPITAWELLTGCTLLLTVRRRRAGVRGGVRGGAYADPAGGRDGPV